MLDIFIIIPVFTFTGTNIMFFYSNSEESLRIWKYLLDFIKALHVLKYS